MAFATTADLASFMGEEFSTTEEATATLALDLATGLIQSETGQTLSRVADDVVTLNGRGDEFLFLPEAPVESVTSVIHDGSTLVDGTDYTWRSWGTLERLVGDWGSDPRSTVVTYTHGYATIPAPVKYACLTLAARIMGNPAGVDAESVGNYSVTHAKSGTGSSAVALSDEERRALAPYRVWAFA